MGRSHTRCSFTYPSPGAGGSEGVPKTIPRRCVSAPSPLIMGAYLTLRRSISEESHLFIYSLRIHEIIKKLAFPGLVSFAATDRFIVVVSPCYQPTWFVCLPPPRERPPLHYTSSPLRTLYYYSPSHLPLLCLFRILHKHHTATTITTTNSTIPL